ncbi:MAG: hypothetical protein H7232_10580 [Aeromicrobium sp.]|nr:hypothetical protein [Burkholderiales bacterium]
MGGLGGLGGLEGLKELKGLKGLGMLRQLAVKLALARARGSQQEGWPIRQR